MQYIFSFRYKPETELNILNEFIKSSIMKWKKRLVQLNGDIIAQFVHNGEIDYNQLTYIGDVEKIKTSGITIDCIEKDNGRFITPVVF
jgi:hypothetical protein